MPTRCISNYSISCEQSSPTSCQPSALSRQQHGCHVHACVGTVEMALDKLEKHETIQLDEERKATMVSNLLVVLCGEQSVSPVVNTGTLYT